MKAQPSWKACHVIYESRFVGKSLKIKFKSKIYKNQKELDKKDVLFQFNNVKVLEIMRLGSELCSELGFGLGSWSESELGLRSWS